MAPEGAIKHIAWLGLEATIAEGVPEEQLRENLQGLHAAMQGLWEKAVATQAKRRRGRKGKRKHLPQFNVGDTMLVARAVVNNKLEMTWSGPHEVTRAINAFVYEVRPCVADQGSRRPMKVHVVRMRRFANGALGTPADAAAIEKAARHDFPDNVVKRLLAHRMTGRGMEINVRWLGFDEAHDTWEPATTLAEDVPELVEAFLYAKRADKRCARLLKKLFPGGK